MAVVLAGCMIPVAAGVWAQDAPTPTPPPPAAADQATAVSPASSAALPPWDVSTVKPSDPDARQSMLWFTPDGMKIVNVPLAMAVRVGLNLEDDRIFGIPAWAKTARFDIEAKVAPEDVTKLKAMKMDERREMLVALLLDRFAMKDHPETKELPLYNLVVAKGGVKMTASKPDPAGSEGKGNHRMMAGRGHFESEGTGMDALTRSLSSVVGRTVIDKTGLAGNFDYKLDWTPDDAPPPMPKSASPDASGAGTAATETSGPSLFTAIQEQLGLKLEAVKGPVDVIVIDQIEQPAAN
jgi:uncharacterized protein (TIGR03435 family)